MTIAAKPSSYTVNTGQTHCPNHLWLIDEASGTDLIDKGSTGGYDMTITGADWATDGTHGPVLTFVAANLDHADYSSVSGLSGTQVIGVVAKCTAGAGTRAFASVCDPTVVSRHATGVMQGDEDIEALSRYNAAAVTCVTALQPTFGWDFLAYRFSDTTIDVSVNGGAWTTQAVSHSGMLAAVTRVTLGALNHSTPANYWNDQICAAMWWKASKSDAEIAAIAADPWQFLDTSALTSQQPQFYRRPNTLLRM